MANRLFDWVSRLASARFILGDRPRCKDLNAALDLMTAGFDVQTRAVAFFAFTTGATVIAADTNTPLRFANEVFDTDAAYDGTSRFTVPAGGGGYYYAVAQAEMTIKPGCTSCDLAIFKNGAEIKRGEKHTVDAASQVRCSVLAHLLLAAGDYLEAVPFWTGTTGTRTIGGITNASFFGGVQLKPNGAQN